MIAAAVTALLMLALPVLLFLAGGIGMMRATGRARFRRRRAEPASVPLNFRLRGYDAAAAAAYWRWLGADGRTAERRFLHADMLFPLVYGGAMLASLQAGWQALGQPVPLAMLASPVVATVVADWVENLLHLAQLARFEAGGPVGGRVIRLAAAATSAKLLCFALSALLVVALAVAVLGTGLRAAG